ncbi:MAG: SMC-Scp complex subunit ScpB [Stellaceae bacterium]|jgi:segregation and condensation protein B
MSKTDKHKHKEKDGQRADHLRLLEALLFASASPVDEANIRLRLPKSADIPSLIAEIEAHYRGRGVNLVKVAGGWTMRTASDLGPRLKLEQKVQRKLSRAAIETLAIVAYHQPVTRAEIEDIRGVVVSTGTLDVLMESNWIAPKGRRETPGRPVTWVTTEAFLQHFGLSEIGDLPGMEELRAAGLIGARMEFALPEAGHLAELPLNRPEEESAVDRTEEAEAAEELAPRDIDD